MAPNDFGPIYAETQLGRFPVEPWNTASNLIFLAIIIYFACVTKLDTTRHRIIVYSLPLMAVGFIGGTVFHATRSHSIWLILDFVPIMLLLGGVSIVLWIRCGFSTLTALALALTPVILGRLLRFSLELSRPFEISIGYLLLGISFVTPALYHCWRRSFTDLYLLLAAFAAFALALASRILDSSLLLPMGTHFLWHLLGGVSTFLVMYYLYQADLTSLPKVNTSNAHLP